MSFEQMIEDMKAGFQAEKQALNTHLTDAFNKGLNLQTSVNYLHAKAVQLADLISKAGVEVPAHLQTFVTNALASIAAPVPAPLAPVGNESSTPANVAAPAADVAPVVAPVVDANAPSAPSAEAAAAPTDAPAV
jgi:hypothetical protein